MAYDLLSLTLQDSYGRQTVRQIEIGVQTTVAEYVTAIGLYLTDLAAVTDLACVRADVILKAKGTPFVGTAGSNVDVGGTVSGLLTDGNGKKGSLKIPGIIPAAVAADGTLDLTNGLLAAYLDNFEPAGDCYISDGETVTTWVKGALDK